MRVLTTLMISLLALSACGGPEADPEIEHLEPIEVIELEDEELGQSTDALGACWVSGSYTQSGGSCFTYDSMRHRAYNNCRNLYGACTVGSVWGLASCGSGTYYRWGYTCERCASCPY
jgi:hypothetical protein